MRSRSRESSIWPIPSGTPSSQRSVQTFWPESAPYDRDVSAKFNSDLQEAEDLASAQPDLDQVGPIGEEL